MGIDEVPKQLEAMGLSSVKLNDTFVQISVQARILFLKRFAERVYKEKKEGAVAEAGVYRGEFSKQINKYFPDRKCYLFDTFEGFDQRDTALEQGNLNGYVVNHFTTTNVELVLSKLPHKEMVEVHKGYVPETLAGIEDIFCFVNLDMDLYQPTLEALKFFYPRMIDGGVILVHDYFSEVFVKIEDSIDDFEKALGCRILKMPIGDDISMAIIKG